MVSAGREALALSYSRALRDATATSAMTHIAVQEALDGTAVTWLEPVSDADYGG